LNGHSLNRCPATKSEAMRPSTGQIGRCLAPPGGMETDMNSIVTCTRKSFRFHGRSGRSEVLFYNLTFAALIWMLGAADFIGLAFLILVPGLPLPLFDTLKPCWPRVGTSRNY